MQAEIALRAGPGPAARRSRVRIGAWLLVTAMLAVPVHAAVAAKKEPAKSRAPASLAVPPPDPALAGPPLDPAWPKHLFVMVDSVMLGAKPNLMRSFPGWEVTIEGRPALMISKAVGELRARRGSYGPVAVVALGYNSLWEKNRKNFRRWADRFDKSVEDMLALLKERGARKIVWVTLRELTPDLAPNSGVGSSQYHKYAWYFPYVNERLRAIKQRHPEMALADWAAAARRPGVTYDAIHLNSHGADLMVAVVKAAIGVDARAAASAAPVTQPAAPPPRAEQEPQPPRAEAQPVREVAATPAAAPRAEEAPAASVAPANPPAKKPSYRTRRLGMFALGKFSFASVVMLGDSLTAGAQWPEITGCPYVANRGVGGDESSDVLPRLDGVFKLKPKAVFLMIGINDILSNVPTETIVKNVEQIIDALTNSGAHVYLTLALPGTRRVSHKVGPKVDELNAAYRKFADKPNVSLVEIGAARNGDGFLRDELSTDGIHLTTKGYRLWRDAILPLVRRHCQPQAALEPAATAQPAADEVTATVIPAAVAPDGSATSSSSGRGDWVIQVGAFPTPQEAAQRIRAARSLSGEMLVNADPVTEKVARDGHELYRARFAGLSKDAAEAACSHFKSNHIDCFVAKGAKPAR
jgi:lysophospholipase L1-like esterase